MTQEENLLDLKQIEEFFKRIGVVLTAFSIFFFIFLEILSNPSLNINNNTGVVFVALLFVLLVVIGYFIFLISKEYGGILIFFGSLVLISPILLFLVLEHKIKSGIFGLVLGILLLLFFLIGFTLIHKFFHEPLPFYEPKKNTEKNWIFYLLCIIISSGVFIIIKYTPLFNSLLNYSSSLFEGELLVFGPLVLSLEVGLVFGLILIPASFVFDKVGLYIQKKYTISQKSAKTNKYKK